MKPSPKIRIHAAIDPKVYRWLTKASEEASRTMSSFVAMVLKEKSEATERKGAK
jgi:hypothetical protein